ncbi:MAG: hypothetical protein FJ398_02045 [Verrucomicrobia bacterium]|nr:hypothetical protein [Verrucomicrobiota bacterium]
MKRNMLIGALTVLAVSLNAADSSPKDAVIAAAKKLGEAANYSWKQTVAVPEGSQFRPGPSDGKTEKDGFTLVSSSFGDNTMQTVVKGGKGAVTNQDGAWQGLAEVEQEEGFGRFRALMARNLKTPAVQAAELAAAAKDLKKDGDAYSSALTEEGAKELLRFRRGGDATTSNAKGSVKFWLKDGALVKYEFKVSGTVSFGGNDRDVDRTTTVEIKDVGATKVNVPEEAKKKLS